MIKQFSIWFENYESFNVPKENIKSFDCGNLKLSVADRRYNPSKLYPPERFYKIDYYKTNKLEFELLCSPEIKSQFPDSKSLTDRLINSTAKDLVGFGIEYEDGTEEDIYVPFEAPEFDPWTEPCINPLQKVDVSRFMTENLIKVTIQKKEAADA